MDLQEKFLRTTKMALEMAFLLDDLHPKRAVLKSSPTLILVTATKYGLPDLFSLQANGYFAEFFVEQCRSNLNKFTDRSEVERHLIYNHSTVFSSREKVDYVLTEVYLFDNDGKSVN